MTTWHFTERLNNEEFMALLPHLDLDKLFLTQICLSKKKWQRLIDVNFRKFKALCVICSKELSFQYIRQHYKSKEHYDLMKLNVKQFYHPFYTFNKVDNKLAFQDESVTFEEKESALKNVNSSLISFARDFVTGDRFLTMVDRREKESIENYLIRLSVDEKIESPEQMFVMAELPFDDIGDLVFCSKQTDNKWQSVLEFQYLSRKGVFLCTICQVTCHGIETVNSHLNGYTHKSAQLDIRALRFKKSSKVTKNCSIQFKDEFKLSINKKAASHFKNILEKWLNSDKDGKAIEYIEAFDIPEDISEKVKVLNDLYQKVLSKSDSEQKSKKNDDVLQRDRSKEVYLGHIGVEYVLKIIEDELDPKPSYECGLCEYIGDERRMQRHLLGYDHRKKYLELHYLNTIKNYEVSIGHMKFVEYRIVMIEIVKILAINIEKHHGRSLPYVVTSKDYDLYRSNIINELYAMQHASQTRGPSFSQIVSMDEIKDMKRQARNGHKKDIGRIDIKDIVFTQSMDSKIYLNQISNDPNIVSKNRKRNTRRTENKKSQPSPEEVHHSRNKSKYRSRDERRQRISTRSRSPLPSYLKETERSDYYRGGDISPTLWNEFYEKLSHITKTIEHDYSNYRKNPENHPQYEEEWNKFWQRRKLELEGEGLNYRTYNFQPEWVQYFKKRIEHLFDYEMQNARNALYHKYNISTGDVDGIPFDDHKNNFNTLLEYDKIKEDSFMQSNPTFISQREFENVSVAKLHGKLKQQQQQQQHHHQNEEECMFSMKRIHTEEMDIDNTNKPTMSDMISISNTNSISDSSKMSNLTDNHSNLVHVLRLITALEDHLGSLGNKVMDLLAISLKLEKNFRGNIMEFESQILTPTNCNMLETAVEKLKGILFAGLVDNKKVSGFNRVIQVTSELLNYAEERGWRYDMNMTKTHPKSIVQLMPLNSNDVGSSHYQLVHDNNKHMQTEEAMNDNYGYNNSNQGRINEPLSCPPPPQIKIINPHNTNLYDSGKDIMQVSGNNNNQGFNQKSLMPLRFQMDNTSHLNFMENDYDINKSMTTRSTLLRGGNNIMSGNSGGGGGGGGGNNNPSQPDGMMGGLGNRFDNNNCRYDNNNEVSQNNIGMMGINVMSDGGTSGGGIISQNHLFGGMHSNDNISNINNTNHVSRNDSTVQNKNVILPMQQNKITNVHHGGEGRFGERNDQKLSEKQISKMSWNSMLRNKRN